MQLKLTARQPGDDLTIMNTMVKKWRLPPDENGKSKYTQCMTIIYKDNKTGMKHKEEIMNPAYEYFIAKPDKRVAYNRTYAPLNSVDAHDTPHLFLESDICDKLGYTSWYKETIRSGDFRKIKDIHKHPDVFMSDNTLEDHYRFWFNNTYTNQICQISKAFFDIEVDGIDIAGDFPEPGEAPVNAITIVFQDRMETYTFLLRNPRNPQIAELEANIQQNLAELKQFVLAHVSENNHNSETKEPFYFGLENMKFNVAFYDEDDEYRMIREFFKLVNSYKPDFCLAWNEAFDLPYLIARIERLGRKPENVICHPDFKVKECFYYVDDRNKDVFDERNDFFSCSSYTVWLDQMIQFASRRKGQTKYLSYGLDAIGTIIAKVKKLDYKDITTQIELLPYKNYKTFFFYNVCDTIVQYCIEYYTQDLEYVFSKCLMNNTRYAKIHRQTVYLANRGQQVLWDRGYVKGNNINYDNVAQPYPGAFVADPLQVNDKSRVFLNGNPTNVFENLVDSDYKSLYPSIMRQFNVFPYVQIGLIIIAGKIHDKHNRTHYEHYTAGGQFCEDLQSHQWLEFGTRWLGLPNFNQLVTYIRDLYTYEIQPRHPIARLPETMDDGCRYPFTQYQKYYFPLYEKHTEGGYYRPFINEVEMSEELIQKLQEWKENVAVTPNQSF